MSAPISNSPVRPLETRSSQPDEGVRPSHEGRAQQPHVGDAMAGLARRAPSVDTLAPRQSGLLATHSDSTTGQPRPAGDLAHTVLQAKLAADVYLDHTALPAGASSVPGWRDVSGDADKLARYGLAPEDLQAAGKSSFRARLYESAEPGQAAQLVFRGTQDRHDWKANLMQGLGRSSDHYERAASIGRKLASDADVQLVGHSLGGGLASVAALTSGKAATTFDAAGLHASTRRALSADGRSLHNGVDITAYHMKGEALTSLQRNTPIPEALGRSVSVPAASGPKVVEVLARVPTLGLLPLGARAIRKVHRHSMAPMISSLEAAAQTSGSLADKARDKGVPPFGHFSKSSQEIRTALSDDGVSHSPASLRKMRSRLNTEAQFVLDFAAHRRTGKDMPLDSTPQRALAAELATELPPGMPPHEMETRLAAMEQRAHEIRSFLKSPPAESPAAPTVTQAAKVV